MDFRAANEPEQCCCNKGVFTLTENSKYYCMDLILSGFLFDLLKKSVWKINADLLAGEEAPGLAALQCFCAMLLLGKHSQSRNIGGFICHI